MPERPSASKRENVILGATVISPAVMLSPNATYCVRLTVGGGVTVTVNEHELDWPRVSTPVHVTGVAPIANSVSLPGAQVI